MVPSQLEVDLLVTRVRGEALNGSFTLLPRHLDIATALRQGLLSYVTPDGHETVLAVDGGTLVKVGEDVLVSTPRAIRGPGLGELRAAIDARFRRLDEREQRARSALERISSELVRRIVELDEMTDRA